MGMEVLGEATLRLRPIWLCYHLIFPTRSDLATAFNSTGVECLEFSASEEVGNGKAKKSFLHPLYVSLTSFLTFLLSLTFLCRNISARAVTLLVPLGLCVVCEM